MTDTVQTAPLEILLRYTCEPGEKIGQLRGCHRVMATYIVDDAGVITGKVQTSNGAADFPADQLVQYLGEQFVTFNAGLEELKAEKVRSESQLEEAKSTIAALQEQLTLAKEENDAQ